MGICDVISITGKWEMSSVDIGFDTALKMKIALVDYSAKGWLPILYKR
jgi:hypothetical protein